VIQVKPIIPLSAYQQNSHQPKMFVGIGKIKFLTPWKNETALIDSIQQVQEENSSINVQIFQYDAIISVKHLYYAVYFAEQAFSFSSNIANTRSMEYLIYASLQRQIKSALEILGVIFPHNTHPSESGLVITAPNKDRIEVFCSQLEKSLKGQIDEFSALELTSGRVDMLQKLYSISDFELKNAMLCLDHPIKDEFGILSQPQKEKVMMQVLVEKMTQVFMENFKSLK
jgi:tRNA threonylcarbamoyladenosine modification (KEOPS) complex Cgi121 subunit